VIIDFFKVLLILSQNGVFGYGITVKVNRKSNQRSPSEWDGKAI